MERRGRGIARRNAMRSGLVVVGAVAFGYLSLQLVFKPFLERNQEAMDISALAVRSGDLDDRRGTIVGADENEFLEPPQTPDSYSGKKL